MGNDWTSLWRVLTRGKDEIRAGDIVCRGRNVGVVITVTLGTASVVWYETDGLKLKEK